MVALKSWVQQIPHIAVIIFDLFLDTWKADHRYRGPCYVIVPVTNVRTSRDVPTTDKEVKGSGMEKTELPI